MAKVLELYPQFAKLDGTFQVDPNGMILNIHGDTLGLKYDFGSIMHYRLYAGSIIPNRLVMIPKAPMDDK